MVNPHSSQLCRLFTRSQVESLLDLDSSIAAVENGFRFTGSGQPIPDSGVLGIHPPGGGLHVKAAVFPAGHDGRLYLAAKLNANFPGNPSAHGLPTIQGLLALFDATNGTPLAVMDSGALTAIRTAAATAVAVKHLSPPNASRLAIAGCGAQSLAQLRAVARVRSLTRILVSDLDHTRAEQFAADAERELNIPVAAVPELRTAVLQCDLILTCTTSTTPLLGPGDLRPGAMIAAVGADNEQKSEIAPALMRQAVVVTDRTAQCALIGDLHHAIAAGAMTAADVYAELGEVVAERKERPAGREAITIFDSTGLPFQDVVTAALVYERGMVAGSGLAVDFSA